MVNQFESPSEIGFAEFAATLISEAFDGVLSSLAEQERRLAEIVALANQDPNEFARTAVAESEVDEELKRLFPSDDGNKQRSTSVSAGAPYTPASARAAEAPAVRSITGVELGSGDYTRQRRVRGYVITAGGAMRIRDSVRLQMASQHQASLQEMVRRGIPRLMVDAGKANAKLTYQLTRLDEADQDDTAEQPEAAPSRPRLAYPLRPLGAVSGLPTSPLLSNVRLLVRQADERDPASSSLNVNLFGEIEISFKTVT